MYQLLSYLGLATVPLAAGIAFSWRVGVEIYAQTSNVVLAVIAGASAGIGLETVGILAGHVLLSYYRAANWILFAVAVLTMIAYVLVGAHELAGTIGETLYYISPLVYILAGLEENLRALTSLSEKDTEWSRHQDDRDARFKHEERLARINAKLSAFNAKPDANDAEASAKLSHVNTDKAAYNCEWCEFSTNSSRSYNAHTRWCKNKPKEQHESIN